jgi:hypothetical protein
VAGEVTDPLTVTGVDGAPNIAVDIAPAGVEGVFTVDDSEVDGPELLSWGEVGWLNVVCDVTEVRVRRGASRMHGVLTRTEAAAVTVEVLDEGRRFDPLVNADVVHAGTPIRLRAWGLEPEPWSAILFTGELDDVPVIYGRDAAPRVTLNASDVIAELAGWRSTGRPDPGIGAGDDLLERVGRVLDETSIGELADPAELDTGYATTHPATTLASGWQTISDAADAELGRVWANAAGRLVVRARGSELTGTIRGTLSDWHGEAPAEPHVCYSDLAATLGTETLANRTIGERRVPQPAEGDPPATEGATVQRDDSTSQARYRTRTVENRSLELETDTQVATWCEEVLIASSVPELRIDSVQPAPWGAGPEAWRAVCETDIGDRWHLRYHPRVGPYVERMAGVLGIELEVTPAGWVITWVTTPAPIPGLNPSGYFAVDVSELDSGDVLAPFGGPVPALEVAP